MREYLLKQNKKFWNSVRERLQQFDMETKDHVSKDEQTQIDMFSNSAIGDISSSLAEFYENVSSSSLPKHDVEQIAASRLNAFSEKACKSIEYSTAKKRDELDITLVDGGHMGDTFALASKSLYDSLNQETVRMEQALNETIFSITSYEQKQTFAPAQQLNK